MQEAETLHEPESASPRSIRRRMSAILAVLVAILLLVVIPPLITVNRFQRRISTNIGASLGRPVHFKSASLSLFPLPGLTLENFVVEEDPSFGSEPILRADRVHANLRIRSLWGRRVEFSKISLTDPSVNLVRTADGHWNVESILVQASHIEAAPTAQPRPGAAPRFPYIEATGARVNLKLDRNGIQEKTPFSLTEADFALWLPQPGQWRIRIEAHPARTDTAPADTGTLHLEATLGSIAAGAKNFANPGLSAQPFANVPIDLHATWQDAQLGGISRLVLGRDAGLRGALTLNVSVQGNLADAAIAAQIQLANARRADFIPPRLLSLEANCVATEHDFFHAYTAIECHWPPADSFGHSVLILAGSVPDVRQPRAGSFDITFPGLPAATLLDWLRVATAYPPTGITGSGTLAGSVAWNSSNPPPAMAPPGRPSAPRQQQQPSPIWSGELELAGESVQIAALGPKPIPLGDLILRSTPPPTQAPHAHGAPVSSSAAQVSSSFDLLPISLSLGGHQAATLEGHFDAHGYTLHLTGTAIPDRLLALADAIPQFGEGLRQLLEPMPALDPAPSPDPTPIRLDLTAARDWGSPQIWRETTPPPSKRPLRH